MVEAAKMKKQMSDTSASFSVSCQHLGHGHARVVRVNHPHDAAHQEADGCFVEFKHLLKDDADVAQRKRGPHGALPVLVQKLSLQRQHHAGRRDCRNPGALQVLFALLQGHLVEAFALALVEAL